MPQDIKLREATKKTQILLIADELEKQVLSGENDETVRNKLNLTKTTFYRLKDKAEEEMLKRAATRQKKLESSMDQELLKAQKRGLKSKLDRVLLLQEQIDHMIDELDQETYTESFEIKVNGNSIRQERDVILTPMQKAYIRKTIKELQAEISKIEGDYAPVAVNVNHSFQDYLMQASEN